MSQKKIKININSEVGELQAVILHKPGMEVQNMTPSNAKRALYSDILNLSVVNDEYKYFSGVLEKVTNVFYLKDLLTEVVSNHDVKSRLLSKITKNCRFPEIEGLLLEKDAKQLTDFLFEGVPLPKSSLTNYLKEDYFALQPLHNFFYMRDSSSAVNNNVFINRMANEVRLRESIIMETIFENHPYFISNNVNPMNSRLYNDNIRMEGGDIQVASEDVLVIGMGTRTSAEGIDFISKKIDSKERPKTIIVQELPETPESFIHLDMVFTFLDRDKCMIYEPVILSKSRYKTIMLKIEDRKIKQITEEENILKALKKNQIDLKPILCGGPHTHNQEREQWHSGANFFAFAPGKVIGYERNVNTIEELNKNGFEVISAKDIIDKNVEIKKKGNVVVTIPGSELSRGGGGARCMTMPLARKN